jgi:RHS repeat-associated protein
VNVRTEYTYSNKLVVDSVKVGGGPARPQEYDADGILTRTGDLRLTNHPGFGGPERLEVASTTVDVSYTPQGEWRAWSASYPGGGFEWELEFEPTGAIGAATVDGVREVYTIDAHAQLTTVTRDGALAERYGYDPRGNRTSVEVGGAQEVATFDARNRVLTQGAVTYTHDEAGYRTARQAPEGRTEYVYDTVGALRSVSLPTGQTVTYGTDPMGRRLTRSVDGQRTGGYVWAEATRLLATTDAAGEVDATFGYGTNPYVPDVVYTPTRTLILLKDHVQSVREVVDADTGEVLQRMDYDAFGRLLLDTNPGLQPFGFAGGLHDPLTGLTRFGVRDYDPETGRFTARDPIGFAGGDTNTYRYALNQPHRLSDPTGHAFWVPIIATAVISGALSTGVYGFLYYTAPEYPTKAGVCTRADFSLGGAAVWFAAGFAAGAIGAYAAAAAGTLVLAEGAVLSTKLAYVFAQSSITALGGAFGGAVSETIKVVGDPRVTFDMGSLGWSMVGGAIAGGITGGISSVGSTFQAFGMSSATQPYNPEAYGVMDGILDIIGAPFGDSISGTF